MKLLFVSHGCICRSPMALGVMLRVLEAAALDRPFELGAAGVTDRHRGRPPSLLAIEAAHRRGYDIRQVRARAVTADDLRYYDLLLAMDRTQLAFLRDTAPFGLVDRPTLLTRYGVPAPDIVDPYGGNAEDYDRTLDLIEVACRQLLGHIRRTLAAGRLPEMRK